MSRRSLASRRRHWRAVRRRIRDARDAFAVAVGVFVVAAVYVAAVVLVCMV